MIRVIGASRDLIEFVAVRNFNFVGMEVVFGLEITESENLIDIKILSLKVDSLKGFIKRL